MQAYNSLRQIAFGTLNSTLSTANGFKLTTQQQQELLGQQQQDDQQMSPSSSMLHVNNYRPSASAAAAASSANVNQLAGTESHVDRGLLTVIYATDPGLQVGLWAWLCSAENVHQQMACQDSRNRSSAGSSMA